MKKFAIMGFTAFLLLAAAAGAARADELEGEITDFSDAATIVRSDGSEAKLNEGDTVKIGETIKVGKGGEAVLALDGDMQNVVYLSENTDLTVNSLYPTQLEITKGDVLSKLKALPKGSTFEITTPNGTAAVRGSEFRTVYGQDGMEVFNIEHSNVYVFNREQNGEMSDTPVVVPQSQTTAVAGRGVKPTAPHPVPANQLNVTQFREKQMMNAVARRAAQPRPPKIPRINDVQRMYQEKARGTGGARPKTIERQERMMQHMDGADQGARGENPRGPNLDNRPDSNKEEGRPGHLESREGQGGEKGGQENGRGRVFAPKKDGPGKGTPRQQVRREEIRKFAERKKETGSGPNDKQPVDTRGQTNVHKPDIHKPDGQGQGQDGQHPQGNQPGGKRPAAQRPAPRRQGP